MTTELVSLYDEGSGKTLGVLLMSLGRKNERFNVKFCLLSKTVLDFFSRVVQSMDVHAMDK